MPISVWQRRNIAWYTLSRSSLLTPEWDDWDNFYITLSPEGHVQMADAVPDASGDAFNADSRHDLSTLAERGTAYTDRLEAANKAIKAAHSTGRPRGRPKGYKMTHPRSDKGKKHHFAKSSTTRISLSHPLFAQE
jgi:hypothetical protein